MHCCCIYGLQCALPTNTDTGINTETGIAHQPTDNANDNKPIRTRKLMTDCLFDFVSSSARHTHTNTYALITFSPLAIVFFSFDFIKFYHFRREDEISYLPISPISLTLGFFFFSHEFPQTLIFFFFYF